jgi:hypothetical protein
MYLGRRIRAGDVFVVDIAMLSSLEEQSFVIGDAMKSIDEIYYATETSNEAITTDSGKMKTIKTTRTSSFLLVRFLFTYFFLLPLLNLFCQTRLISKDI